MRTSDASARPVAAKRTRSILYVVAFLVVAMLANRVLTFALVPYGSKSQVAWNDYKDMEQLDCLIVGTSTAMRGIDPQVLDESWGMQCFNLATPDQTLEESLLAIQTAYEDYGIGRVVLGMSFSQTAEEWHPNPGGAFIREWSRAVDVPRRIDGLSYILLERGGLTREESLNMCFPWVSNREPISVDTISSNIIQQLNGTTLHEAAALDEPGWVYTGKWFNYYTKVLNYNGVSVKRYYYPEDFECFTSVEVPGGLNADRAEALRQICTYCADHDIELIAVMPPMPEFQLLACGDGYETFSDTLRSCFDVWGGCYFDMNLATKDTFDLQESFFADSAHLSINGATAFSQAIVRAVNAVEAGKDPQSLFLTWDQRVAAIDYISGVFVEPWAEPDGIHLDAAAMAGPQVEIEYQLLRKVGDDWVVLEDWKRDGSFVYLPENGERGTFTLCVNARVVGSGADYDRYHQFYAMY